ncbi:hypothetical protein BX666DRAFT_1874375 [Dichotomocladium elegans]|nr:hypothetical protein BX666DRAFT_1874375 [Dichotomocladium elegans]
MPFGNLFNTPSLKKRSSTDDRFAVNDKRASASVESSAARVRHRLSAIISTTSHRKSSASTVDSVVGFDDEPRYSSSSDESSLQQPPTPPPHATFLTSYMCASPDHHYQQKQPQQPMSLADNVRFVLGSALDEVDEEIEVEWEVHRKKLRQSLLEPIQPLSPTWQV